MYLFKVHALGYIPVRGLLPSAYAGKNNFSRVCLFIYVFIQAVTFELLKLGISSSVNTYIFTISRSSLSTKVIGSRSTE